ncbi:hypothetical protein I4U23_008498 [Adineta vaga]|nr:hypothetical protein I4U23_008498 [Adineta vaga]
MFHFKIKAKYRDLLRVELRINENNQLEKINSHTSEKCIIITRRYSKPSRHDSVQIITSEIRQRQMDRYRNYAHQLNSTQLYSFLISFDGVECYDTNCHPSIFNASYRCRTMPFKALPSMNDQDIKHNISYISLTNLSNIIDHEPNVSRRNSYTQSSSNVLTHKTSLFLADIFNKMTYEQRTKSIVELTKLHEHLTKSKTALNKLQRTTSLPNLHKITTKLDSVTSLFAEETATYTSFEDQHITNLNKENLTKQKVYTQLENGQLLHTDNSSTTASTIPSAIIHLSTVKPSLLSTKSTDLPLVSKQKSVEVLKVNETNTQLSNSIVNSMADIKQERISNENENLQKTNDLMLNSPMETKKDQINPLFSYLPSSKDEDKREINLNDVTEYLLQQDVNNLSTNYDVSFTVSPKESNKTNELLATIMNYPYDLNHL